MNLRQKPNNRCQKEGGGSAGVTSISFANASSQSDRAAEVSSLRVAPDWLWQK